MPRAAALALTVLALTLTPHRARADINATAWMRDDAIRDKPIASLVLPGTHDSGTAWLSRELLPGSDSQLPKWATEAVNAAERFGLPADDVVRRWAKAQTLTIGEQLRRGARYVDLRCGWTPDGEWRTHHALIGRMVDELLEEVKVFLVENPSEVVIVEMTHFFGGPRAEDVERLATVVEEIFGELLAPYPGSTKAMYDIKVKDFVDANHRAIVVFEDDRTAAEWKFWPARTITNTYADTDDENGMENFNREVVRDFNKPSFAADAILKLSWTLTTQPKTVIEALDIFKRYPRNLLQLADRANARLSAFTVDATNNHCSVANIIVVDDLANSDVLEVVARLNAVGASERGRCAWTASSSSPRVAIERRILL